MHVQHLIVNVHVHCILHVYGGVRVRRRTVMSSVNLSIREITHNRFAYFQIVGAMHFIYYINRLTTTKVDSTYLGC